MISITDLSIIFGTRLLFDEVNLNLIKGKRYGLVGANGAGKSTFLKLLAGEEQPSLGEVVVQKNSTIGWLKQDLDSYEDDKIINAVLRGKNELWKALVQKEKLIADDVWNDETGYLLGELEETIMNCDGYTAETFATKLLIGLGIPEEKHHDPLNTLSGGYKLRVLLAQSLFNQPDILLLDEPTNHLDIRSIAWLEQYLINEFQGVLVFISHDQDFLNNLSTHILDIDYGDIKKYTGNFDKFLIQKEATLEQIENQKLAIERKIAHMQSFVDRFKAKASKAKQAKSREKMIDRVEIPEIKKTSRIAPNFNFQQRVPSGKTVLKISGIEKSFETKKVLRDINFTINKGDKVAIIGPNGMGKSTLLKIITQNITPDRGEFEWGYAVNIGYFAQDHHESLTDNQTVFNWLEDSVPDVTSGQLRSVLGKVLFSSDDVNKNIQSISGGEAARLLLAKVMLQKPNVLVLDEPTNHMDLESVNSLIQALKSFEGTLILVSHNRYVVSEVATRVVALTPKGIDSHIGSYEDYLKKEGIDYFN